MAERRDRMGKAQGVKTVTCLEGDAVWNAADKGVWSWDLLHHALGRSHTVNPGDVKQNTRDFSPPAVPRFGHHSPPSGRLRGRIRRRPRATALILNGHVDDTTVAVRLNDATGRSTVVSTLMYLPAPPAPAFSTPWSCASKTSSRRASPPTPSTARSFQAASSTPVCRAAWNTTGRSKRPELAAIDYAAPADSGFIRNPLTNPAANRT